MQYVCKKICSLSLSPHDPGPKKGLKIRGCQYYLLGIICSPPPPPILARFYGKIRCFNYRFDYLQTAEYYIERQRKVSKQECLFYLLIELNKKARPVFFKFESIFLAFYIIIPIPKLRRLVLELGSNSYCFIR